MIFTQAIRPFQGKICSEISITEPGAIDKTVGSTAN